VLARLGRTDQVVLSTGLFRERLADELGRRADFTAAYAGIAPLVVAQGAVTTQGTGRRATTVRVYGVDDRFWQFHGVPGVAGPDTREAFLSPALARRLDAEPGQALLVRVPRPTDAPLESIHGRRDELGETLRLTAARVLTPTSLGEFSLEARQGDVLAVFVPLPRLQQELDIPGRVNTLLVSARGEGPADATGLLKTIIGEQATLDDLGFVVSVLDSVKRVVIASETGLLDAAHESAAMAAAGDGATGVQQLFTYLANGIRTANREIPYSLVTALDLSALDVSGLNDPTGDTAPTRVDPIVLTDWAAGDLQARPGDTVTLEYYVWEEPGQLATMTAELRVAGIVPLRAGDPDMAPTYSGITDAATLDAWDPPFPIDLRRVRRVDEEYWEQHRTTPKAFVSLETGRRLWASRHGSVTSVRLEPGEGESLETARRRYDDRLRTLVDPLAMGLSVVDVRAESLGASRGATDFGEYFVYFSLFLVVSALLLAALFFKLGIEQRAREVGLLRAVGAGPAGVRRLFLAEGVLLSGMGSVLGAAGATGYARLMMYGLRTWWVDAVGTTALTLHLSAASIAAGAVGGVVAALACIWWTLRSLDSVTERSLLMGSITPEGVAPQAATEDAVPGVSRRTGPPRGRLPLMTLGLAIVALGLLLAASAGVVPPAGAFFGAGSALLAAWLSGSLLALGRRARRTIEGRGLVSVTRLGLRNATYRPGRSVLSIAVIASATFILIAVDAFRRSDTLAASGPGSGVGGYDLIVETLLPIVRDPNTPEGRDALNLFELGSDVTIEPFRLLPGDDASCLNLYEPRNPRILAPRDAFIDQGRFAFQSSLATTEEERANPWLLLRRTEPDGAIPVIADANSMTYVLHKRLGDDIVLAHGLGEVRLRLVAALGDSLFQSELLMAPERFIELFPAQGGYRVLLVEDGGSSADATSAQIFEESLADFGPTIVGTADRLAQFHRVENTYLSTFQTLGGLGLILGTFGLGTVLLRNVLERRRELALLGAVGYRRAHLMLLVLAENVLLLAGGLVAGALSAAVAILPAISERGGRLPQTGGAVVLLLVVFTAGLLSSVLAIQAATRTPLLESLKSE
jgi:ABC-type lipoprotein release transport system permease subunit